MKVFAYIDPFVRRPTDAELERDTDRYFLVLVLASAAALVVALLAFMSLVGALMLAASPVRASEPSAAFACRGVPFVSDEAKAAFAEHAPSHAAQQVLIEHALRWDGAEMRRLCEAKAAGDDVTLACLDGRRDWNALVAGVPDGQLALPRTELNQVLAGLREERRANPPHQSALNHCIRIGAVDGLVQPTHAEDAASGARSANPFSSGKGD